MKKHPDWFKLYWEVEHVALKDAPAPTRAIYHYLRTHSPGYECEPVENVDYRTIAKELHVGQTTVGRAIKELERRKLIEKISASRKDGIKFQFIFEYLGSTIRTIKGQVIIIAPSQEQRLTGLAPNEEQSAPNQEQSAPNWEQLPYIDREKKHVHDALLKQVMKQLDELNVYDRIYKPIIKDPIGARFVHDILQTFPHESGPVIRTKIQDQKNLNQFKIIDMFYREGSQMPNGTLLKHWKTGEQGEWHWSGKSGFVRLSGDNVMVDSLASFRGWKTA